MTCIATLSAFSDWMCRGLVNEASKQSAGAIGAPGHFIEMLFWIEDKRFPVHVGADPIAMLRATVFNIRGRTLQGASTIVQQVCTIHVSGSRKPSRSLPNKLRQIQSAIYLSAVTSKASILKEYVDSAYWGRSYRGLDRAAQGYFSASRDSLTIEQSFFLAERLAAPNRVSTKRISNLLKRSPIRLSLTRHGAALSDVIDLYDRNYGCGGEMWLQLAR